jgi:hypothetical protein
MTAQPVVKLGLQMHSDENEVNLKTSQVKRGPRLKGSQGLQEKGLQSRNMTARLFMK